MVIAQSVLTNPFPGLRPFESHEAHLFFGREDQTDELLRRLRRNRFLAIVGTSGSGKSSLVRAGLLPSLYSGFMAQVSSSWRVAVFRPGNDPIGNMAGALNDPNVLRNDPDVLGVKAEDTETRTIITEATLRYSALGLIEVVRHAKMPAGDNLLIVVDQFEELFRFKQSKRKDSKDEAEAFVKLLLEAIWQRELPIYIVLTMRSDFLGDCARFRDLPEAINDSQYLIPRLTRDQRRMAVVNPIAVGGGKITPRLVNQLLNDLGDNPDQLPILQHALMRTWDYWMDSHDSSEPIDLHHYKAIGGMSKALSQHADEIYNNLPDARSQKIAEKLFKCLTDRGQCKLGIRRPTKLKKICEVAAAEKEEVVTVINQFRSSSRSFLMPPEDIQLDENTVIDISHESLMRVWDQLNEWVDQEKQSSQIYRRLAETSALYQEGKTGLLEDPELTIDLKWSEETKPNQAWAERYEPNFQGAMQFLEKSKAAYAEEVRRHQEKIKEKERLQKEKIKEQNEEIERRKRNSRNLRFTCAAMTFAFILASGLGIVNLILLRRAEEGKIQAISASSNALYKSGQDFDALIVGLRAQSLLEGRLLKLLSWGSVDTDTKNEVLDALQQALYRVQEQNRLAGHTDQVYQVIFSPDGQMLASASADKTVKLWKRDGTLIGTLEGHSNKVTNISFSPDGQMLTSASWDGTVKLWKRDGTLIDTLEGHKDRVYQIIFSPDGQMLASAGADKTVRLWKRDGTLLKTLTGHSGQVFSARFSPDGQILASASADKTVKLWKRDGTLLKTLKGHDQSVQDIRFSPNGQMLASASWDGTVKLWKHDGNAFSPFSFRTLKGHEGPVYRVSFSPNGQMLASAGADKTVRLWKRDGTLLKTLTGHSGQVTNISFSPDSQMLASGSYDRSVKIWRIDGTLLNTFTGHKNQIHDVSFSLDNQTLASASADKTVKLWKLRDLMTTVLVGHEDWVSGITFSPDDQIIASTSQDKTVKLWKRDGTLLKTLEGHNRWVQDIRFSPDGQILASASWDGTVKLWKRDGTLIDTLEGHQGQVQSVRFSPDGQILASASYDNTVKLWRRDGNSFIVFKALTGHKGGVVDLDFSPNGQMLASASNDKTVKLWKRDGTLIDTLAGHNDQVYSVSFSPNGQMLASASNDNTVKLWKRDGNSFNFFKALTMHDGPVYRVSFSPNGQMLASASADKTVKLWKRDGTLLTTLVGHDDGVFGVSFSSNSQTLASSSNDKTVRLWKLLDTSAEKLSLDLAENSCVQVGDYLRTNPLENNSNLCNSF